VLYAVVNTTSILSVSYKGRKILNQLSDYQLAKEYSAPWCWSDGLVLVLVAAVGFELRTLWILNISVSHWIIMFGIMRITIMGVEPNPETLCTLIVRHRMSVLDICGASDHPLSQTIRESFIFRQFSDDSILHYNRPFSTKFIPLTEWTENFSE
jgi:hypothetical protein